MNENFTHSVELIDGFTDKDGATHKKVVFGKRLTVKDLMILDTNPQAQNPTQYGDLIRRNMITEFGTMKMPVPITTLLSLNSIDREDLQITADSFVELGRGERTAEFLEDNKVKLPFGFIVGETEYDVIQFGNLTTGNDEVEADKFGQGLMRTCFLIGRQISKISTNDETAAIEGQVDLTTFESLDAESLNLLRVGAELFRQSFRIERKGVSGKRNGGDSVSSGA